MNNIIGMFRGSKNSLESGGISAADTTDDLIRCPDCKCFESRKAIAKNKAVCANCGHHFRVSARNRIVMIADRDTFTEHDASVTSCDPLDFPGYRDKLERAKDETGENEAVITGEAKIGGECCVIISMEPRFIMASMGSAVGEKICRAFEYATENHLPVVAFTASGGARMQEGILSLMQMAKVSAAVGRHGDAGNLYITVLTDPTTGGVTASFAMEGDIILAEPDALTAFAGPRVIEQNMHKRLPKGFQRSEFLLEHGFCDAVVPRGEIALTVGELLALHEGHAPGLGAPHEIVHTGRRGKKLGHLFKRSAAPKTALEIVKQTRSADRATAGEMISLGLDGFVELHGDRYFGDDAAVVAGIGWKDGRPVTVIAIERGTTTKERMRRNFGMAHPEGYRKARRLMRQAEKFGRPVLCLVDTSGAFCGIGAEERGQGEAIAQNLLEMSGLKTPIVSVVTGEGGSGGALALSVADRILMLSSSAYSVVSPEACASILWKDTDRANEAAEALKLTAPDLLALGIIDGIVDDRGLSHEEIAGAVMSSAFDAFDTLGQLDEATLTNLRYEKYRAIGQYRTM